MKISKNFYISLLVVFTCFYSCKEDDDIFQSTSSPKNISEIVSERQSLSVLADALAQVRLDSTLSSTTTYTVFAPNNSAFSDSSITSLTNEALENVLLNHVLSTVTADFTGGMETGYLTTLATGPDDNNISFYTNTEGDLIFNGVASLVDNGFDLGATNGVIHTVDAVLMPPTVVDHVMANPDYSSLASAIALSGLSETLSISDPENENYPYTLFAPNNIAFEALIAQVNGAFGWVSLSDIPEAVLQQIILYHVVSGANTRSSEVDGTTQTSMQGDSFSISGTLIDDATYNDAEIVLVDIQGVNGVVHGVDKVLLPEDVFQSILSATLNIVERSNDRGFTTFIEAVEKVGLTNSLSTDELTAFAPNNDAFVGLFAAINNFETLADFDTPEELTVLTDLINYHLHAGSLMASQLTDGGTISTLYGDDITADLSGDNARLLPSFGDAIPSTITMANIGANNGVIHEINRVLIPEALLSALGIETGEGGLCPVGDPSMVFFDWDANGPWWGNVVAENTAALSIDGSSYGRANFQTGGVGWQDLFWRNDAGTFNGAAVVGSNLSSYSLKFDMNVIEPMTDGMVRIRFNDADGVDAFYDWAPWNDTGEPFTTDGWETIEIPLSVLGVPDFSLVDAEFGMAFEGADVLLNFAIDNVRFDTPGCGGPDPIDDTSLVFFDWDANGPWWGNVVAENDVSLSLDGSAYGRANFQTGSDGWQDLFWRNDAGTFNGASTVGSNLSGYVLKFDINTLEPLTAGMFRIRFNDADGVDAFYDWAPWNDTGEAFDSEGWTTVSIPCSILGVPDFSLVDAEFGMAFEGADVLLNFAIDNVRFEAL
ncbi:putative surface protein with fasciclin (FAS1) repeats [Winogradskyella pacifica]|uniref:Putative surface protein with fasciclin (FAS1) repeats n=1 Tax=Winogradskyella pacifica TaxID=664642 RepID=A0A3D9NAK1_9FLAO|nr:glycan-binding surface protein [Winogradskyella pacifica]REE27519.1 putative surface protein with fasciclin (FAS1) repeats [Winogradskyella pacifica]